MSREPSTELFELIQALSQTEKRYVKQELQRHVLGEVNQSELLFDAVAGQEHYNEASIRKRFAGYGFVKRMPEAKRELIAVILRAMRQYHAERTPMRRAMSGYADGEFLRSRGLHRWSERKFREAAAESELIQHHHLNALALYGLVTLHRTKGDLPDATLPIEADAAYRKAVDLQEVAIFEGINDRMQGIVSRYGTTRNQAAVALASDLVRKGEQHLPTTTIAAQNYWLRALSLKAFFMDGDVKTALELDRARLEVIERDEQYRRANYNVWMQLVHSVGVRLVMSGDPHSAHPLRDRMRQFWQHESSGLSPQNRRASLGNYMNLELLIAIHELSTATDAPPIAAIRTLVDEYESFSPSELGMVCRFNLGLLLFGLERFRDAVRQLNLVDDYAESLRPEIHRASRYLRILCHVDQGHESVVTSMVRKERRLAKGASIPQDEEIFLNMASRYLLQAPGKQRTALLKATLEALGSSGQNDQSSITGMFAFKAWIKAKLTNGAWRQFLADRLG